MTFATWLTGSVNGGFVIGQADGVSLSLDAAGVAGVDVAGERVLSDATALEDDRWGFFVVTAEREGSGTRLFLFRDGLEVAETLIEGGLGNSRSGTTLIGNARGGEDVPYPGRAGDFQGKLDAVRIYDRALSADEIAVLFAEDAAR